MRSESRADAAPWPELVRTVHKQMRSLVGPQNRELEDLAQLALERLVVALPRFEGRAELTTFAYGVCVNVAMGHWRGWRRWVSRFRFWGDDVVEPPAAGDLLETWIQGERARRLHAYLARLAPVQRVCVTLADLEELPASRIAEILDCPEPTVRSRLRAGRERLVAMLRRDPLFASDDEVTHG
jgi:RNA polymerase sigma-70 factor, ECF subfamily